MVIGERIIRKIDNMELLLHAGDFIKDAEKLEERLNIKVEAVVGNCDYPRTSPEERIIEVDNCRIYMTHGHIFEPHDFFNDIMKRSKEKGANLVVFGHTHLATSFEEEGIFFLNPGSISMPRMKGPTYGIIEINEGKINTEILSYKD